MQPIQSSNAPIQFRKVGTIPWKTMVCVENYSVPVATTVTTTDTFCGRAVGLGPRDFTPTLSAVCEAVPTATQMTYQDALVAQINGDLYEFLVEVPGTGPAPGSGSLSVGSQIYLNGQGYFTNTELQGAVNDVLKFTTTFTGQGDLDITP